MLGASVLLQMNIVGVGLHVIEQTLIILADFVLKTPKVRAHKVKCIWLYKTV